MVEMKLSTHTGAHTLLPTSHGESDTRPQVQRKGGQKGFKETTWWPRRGWELLISSRQSQGSSTVVTVIELRIVLRPMKWIIRSQTWQTFVNTTLFGRQRESTNEWGVIQGIKNAEDGLLRTKPPFGTQTLSLSVTLSTVYTSGLGVGGSWVTPNTVPLTHFATAKAYANGLNTINSDTSFADKGTGKIICMEKRERDAPTHITTLGGTKAVGVRWGRCTTSLSIVILCSLEMRAEVEGKNGLWNGMDDIGGLHFWRLSFINDINVIHCRKRQRDEDKPPFLFSAPEYFKFRGRPTDTTHILSDILSLIILARSDLRVLEESEVEGLKWDFNSLGKCKLFSILSLVTNTSAILCDELTKKKMCSWSLKMGSL